MVLALVPPAILVLSGKWHQREIGFEKMIFENCKKVFFFLPLLAIFIPVAVKGFYVKSTGYVLGSLFLYLFVGISEEVYFRGIIPRCLKKEFSTSGVVVSSTFIFGIGHIATALTGSNAFEIFLTVLNALIFGWLAMEMTIISSCIVPAILVHFLFDFETKVIVMSGSELLVAECIRGAIMFILAVWLAVVIYRQRISIEPSE